MTLTTAKPFTLDEITKLSQEYEVYIKTVIDIENKICVAGMKMHYQGEKILLDQGSRQKNIWGGGIDLETKEIDYNSLINIRPQDKNTRNEIQDSKIRELYLDLSKYFFKKIL